MIEICRTGRFEEDHLIDSLIADFGTKLRATISFSVNESYASLSNEWIVIMRVCNPR